MNNETKQAAMVQCQKFAKRKCHTCYHGLHPHPRITRGEHSYLAIRHSDCAGVKEYGCPACAKIEKKVKR